MTYTIKRDGKKMGSAKTYNDALGKLHRLSPFSWSHSMKYEGWSIVKEKKK